MNDSFRLAQEQHQQGFLDQAAQLYVKVLGHQPDHADALHLLGVVALQSGRPWRAVELIGRAIAVNPRVSFFLSVTDGGAATRAAAQCIRASVLFARRGSVSPCDKEDSFHINPPGYPLYEKRA
jgi:hypothetical protein